MNLEPAVQAHLDAEETMPPGLDWVGRRDHLHRQVDAHFRRFGLPGPHVAEVSDHALVSWDGGAFRVRIYHPRPGTALPVHLLVHGGGWVSGSIDELVVDATARHRAVGADVAVVSVDYRLAPEHPCPAALSDVIAAMRWIREEGALHDLDGSDVSAGGSSAGANLLAGAALLDAPPRWRALLLEVPALDLTGRTVLAELDEGDYPVPFGEELDSVQAYVPDVDQRQHSFVSPLLAPSVDQLPPTWVLTAGLDPLQREGALFVDRLKHAGVPAELRCYPGALHGSPILNGSWDTARRWHDDTVAILRGIHLQRDGSGRRGTAEEMQAR